ncbi:MAG: glutamyl-tRNA reductase [Candidatus Solibacter usitatus]|nr:glutamyl-tRNA reductase [Candidatus Solibacter usitatus]
MKLHITGINHRTAPVEVREKLAYPSGQLDAAVQHLIAQEGVNEGLILSTCNRVEVVVSGDAADARALVEQFLESTRQMPHEQLAPHLYHLEGREAIRHLFRVAASLDSMVLGEPQILGQLKDAYSSAKSIGAVNGFLDGLLSRAFSVAKRVRTETQIGQSAVSVSYAAVELAREIFGSLSGRSVLLAGAGKMSELAARHLHRAGATRILVTNRTLERATEMAKLFDGTVVPYDMFLQSLAGVDIVITSSAAPHHILTREQMRSVLQQRRNRPIFLIDIAVPRNIEPSVNELDNVFLYDIDDMGKVIEGNRQARQEEAREAERIIEEEVDKMLARLRERELAPAIVSLQDQLEQIRCIEMERVRGKLGALTPQQTEAIEALTKGIVAKVAHGPIAEMRRHANSGESSHMIDLVRRLFRLPGRDS